MISNRFRTGLLALVVTGGGVLVLPKHLLGQVQDPVYFDYQLRHGKEQQLHLDALPKAIRLYGELRGRTEGQTSFDLDQGDDRTYELTRIRGGLEADIGPTLRATLAFQDTHALGLPAHAAQSTMRDQFDLFTGNLDLHWKDRLHLVAGRQPLTFGSEHLVGISDWANNSRSFDGFTAKVGSETNLELFSVSAVEQHATSLDKHGAGLTFHGAVVTIPVAAPHLKVQPFVYIRAVPHVQAPVALAGPELETTFGTEVSGTEKSGLELDLLGALQRGSRASYSVSSGAAVARVAWLFQKTRWKPRPVAEFDYASGDSDTSSTRTNTFDQLYASNHSKFGLNDQFGLQNLIQYQGNLDLSPVKNATVRIEGEILRLASSQDNVYSSAGTVLVAVPTNGFGTTDLGRGIDLSSTYVYRQYLLFEAGVGHLFAGAVLNQAGRPSTTVAYLQISYKFRFFN